jgi:hypothetical protein
MCRFRWSRVLDFLGLKFWLPLPLLALLFWGAGKILTIQMLQRTHQTQLEIEANTQREIKTLRKVLSIEVKIQKNKGLSLVEVNTFDSAVKELEFKVKATEPKQIEAAVVEELGLSLQEVRRLVRYRYYHNLRSQLLAFL